TPEWVPADGEDTGWYTWVARYDGADGTSATHACGDDAESFFAQLAPGWFAVHKTTEAHADEPVRGARYHLFVASSDLPAAYLDCTVRTYVQHVPTNCDDTYAATTAPTDLAGYRFVGEVATDAAGSFRAPAWAGARYCLREVAAPENWLVDPAVRCAIAGGTGSSDADSVTTSGAATVMLTNTRVMGTLRGRKFDASAPGQAIGGAEYAVYAMVDGAVALADSWFRDAPTNVPVVPGLRAFAAVTTDGDGSFAVAVPSGARWCVRETNAPAGWRADLSLLCTPAAVDSATLYTALIELPEQRLPPQLARTGSSHDVARAGILLAAVGLALHAVSGAHGARGAAAPARRSLRPPRRRARR
ncbi:MAG TPA: hypothetical protein VGQ20_12985, partial [Acidimicrobiales bacterium]|nr:hypothetical protein [Acidimicrobiales bacterium]